MHDTRSRPAASKAADGDYYADYGGYVAICYNSAKIKTPPTSLKSLLNPIYKNEVAINGNPSQTGAGFAAVYAAALANGGSTAPDERCAGGRPLRRQCPAAAGGPRWSPETSQTSQTSHMPEASSK